MPLLPKRMTGCGGGASAPAPAEMLVEDAGAAYRYIPDHMIALRIAQTLHDPSL